VIGNVPDTWQRTRLQTSQYKSGRGTWQRRAIHKTGFEARDLAEEGVDGARLAPREHLEKCGPTCYDCVFVLAPREHLPGVWTKMHLDFSVRGIRAGLYHCCIIFAANGYRL